MNTTRPNGGPESIVGRFQRRPATDQESTRAAEGLRVADIQLGARADPAQPTLKIDVVNDSPDEAVGQMLGHYKLLEKLGEGGCGLVYVAEQTEPVRRRVAVKVIKLGMDTKAVVARFEMERQALAMMDHPNIAKVLDAGSTKAGRPYFVMELVRGIRITEYCDQNNLPTKDRLKLFIKICQAIQHAHQKGIIHRDIKPSNILVTLHDGVPVPKVIDFGIAKATEGRLTDATVYTQLHQFIGTPAYMSPEQAEMSGLDIDTRSDIYSLGVLLYELLVGRTPFDGSELVALGLDAMRRAIREKEPTRPSTKLATLPGEELTTTAKRRSIETSKLAYLLRGDLDWIVMKCLEKDRSRRYETANALAMDLKRYLNNEPVLARPPSAAYRFQKAWRRNKVVFTAGMAVAAALLIGVGLSTWESFAARKAQRDTERARLNEQQQRVRAQQQQAEAEAERQRADAQAAKVSESQQRFRRLLYVSDMNLAQEALRLNNLGKARRLLDRHRPQLGEEDLRGWEWRYLWQLTRSTALVTLTNRPSRGFSVSFSPDGSRLAVGWSDGRVDLWDVPGRRWLRALTESPDATVAQVAFSPVQNLLAATSPSNTITLYDLDSGRESILWRAPNPGSWEIRDLSFSADGARLLIYAGSDATRGDKAWVINIFSKEIESQHPTSYSSTPHSGAARLSPDNRTLYLARSDWANQRYSIRGIDLASGRELWSSEPQRDSSLTALAISPEGKILASGSGFGDPAVRVWDASTGRLLVRLTGHTAWVCKLVFSKDGHELISAASDQTIRFWDTTTWTETRVLRGHTDEVHAVALSEPAQLLASGARNGDLVLWNAQAISASDGYRLLPDNLINSEILPLDHSHLCVLSPGQPPTVMDANLDSPPQAVPGMKDSADGLEQAGANGVCYWDGTNQVVVSELTGAELKKIGAIPVDGGSRPPGAAYNEIRRLLAWCEASSPNSVYLASLAAPARRIELRSDRPGLIPFSFSPDGTYVAAHNTSSGTLRAWNVDTGQVVASLNEGHTLAMFAAGGQVLVVLLPRGENHEVQFYDLIHPNQPPRRVPGKSYSAGLAVSPDGKLVACSTYGGLLRLFDPLRGELISNLQGHLNGAHGLAFSADGKRLISGSVGRESIKVWDLDTRQELLTLPGTGLGGTTRWSLDGDLILSGRPWQIWRAPSWAEIVSAEKAEAKVPQP